MTKPVMLTEPAFCPHSLNKYASLMTLGNGYMGIRASHEEAYTLQTRGMYLAGLYHRARKVKLMNWLICLMWWAWRSRLMARFSH